MGSGRTKGRKHSVNDCSIVCGVELSTVSAPVSSGLRWKVCAGVCWPLDGIMGPGFL